MEKKTLNGKGKVWSYTRVYDPPAGYETYAPYTVAIIELDEGPKITAQLTDLDRNEEIKIGMSVEMVTRVLRIDGDDRERGMIVYGYKFRPILRRI
jgi:uncharacterized protein